MDTEQKARITSISPLPAVSAGSNRIMHLSPVNQMKYLGLCVDCGSHCRDAKGRIARTKGLVCETTSTLIAQMARAAELVAKLLEKKAAADERIQRIQGQVSESGVAHSLGKASTSLLRESARYHIVW